MPGIIAESWAKFRVWAWAYSMMVPARMQEEPMLPTTRYLKAASSAPKTVLRKAVSATAAKVRISTMMNMLNRSPERTRPITPPQSIRNRV